MTGRQLDARKQNRQDMSKRAPSPAAQLHPKKARTPSTEEEDETDQMVRLSREEVQKQGTCPSSQRKPQPPKAKSEVGIPDVGGPGHRNQRLLHPCWV